MNFERHLPRIVFTLFYGSDTRTSRRCRIIGKVVTSFEATQGGITSSRFVTPHVKYRYHPQTPDSPWCQVLRSSTLRLLFGLPIVAGSFATLFPVFDTVNWGRLSHAHCSPIELRMMNEIRDVKSTLKGETQRVNERHEAVETVTIAAPKHHDRLSINFINISSILFCLSSITSKRLLNPGSPPSLSSSSITCPAVSGTLEVEGLNCIGSGLL